MITEVFFGNAFFALLLLQSTICVALGLAGSFLLRHRAARAHQVLLLGMLAAIFIPALYALVNYYELGILTANADISATEPLSAHAIVNDETSWIPAIEDAGHSADAGASYLLPASAEPAGTGLAWRSVLVWAWITASALLLCRLVMTFLLGVRLLRKAEPLRCRRMQEASEVARQKLGISKSCQIYATDRVRSPVIWCWAKKPVLLVPGDAEHLNDSADWVGMFCHELAHWKRSDHISGLLAELMSCALPWHPLMWWAKRRLVELSEQACDDWVVASGQPGTEYAESLLDLAPEGQLAFLPTIVGKEKHMEQRIQRIVKQRCGNPRIGIRWALAVSTIAACIAVAAAFAQERPARFDRPRDEIPRERVAEREEAQLRSPELMEQQRLELAEKLRQLEERAHDIEQKLDELPEDEGEQAHDLRAELREIHQKMEGIERRLQALDRDRPRLERGAPPEFEAQRRELLQHRRALHRRAGEIEHQLGQLRDDQDEEARQLRAERREIREQIRRIENELRDAEPRRRELRDRERPVPEVRRRELMQRRRQLEERAHHLERELRELGDRKEAREVRTQLRATQEQIREVDQQLRRPERERPEQERLEELRRAILRLAAEGRYQQAERLEREAHEALRRQQEPPPAELERQVHELRTEVQGLRREMAELRELLQQVLQQPRPEPEPSPERAPRAERERRRDAERREPEERRERERPRRR